MSRFGKIRYSSSLSKEERKQRISCIVCGDLRERQFMYNHLFCDLPCKRTYEVLKAEKAERNRKLLDERLEQERLCRQKELLEEYQNLYKAIHYIVEDRPTSGDEFEALFERLAMLVKPYFPDTGDREWDEEY